MGDLLDPGDWIQAMLLLEGASYAGAGNILLLVVFVFKGMKSGDFTKSRKSMIRAYLTVLFMLSLMIISVSVLGGSAEVPQT